MGDAIDTGAGGVRIPGYPDAVVVEILTPFGGDGRDQCAIAAEVHDDGDGDLQIIIVEAERRGGGGFEIMAGHPEIIMSSSAFDRIVDLVTACRRSTSTSESRSDGSDRSDVARRDSGGIDRLVDVDSATDMRQRLTVAEDEISRLRSLALAILATGRSTMRQSRYERLLYDIKKGSKS